MAAMTREYAVKEQVKFEEIYLKICFFKKKKKQKYSSPCAFYRNPKIPCAL